MLCEPVAGLVGYRAGWPCGCLPAGILLAAAGCRSSPESGQAAMKGLRERLGVVVLTHTRAQELARTLTQLLALPEQPQIVVVDNASSDTTCEMVIHDFPQVRLLALERNIGAAARNAGVAALETDYVAFCDDDTWWDAGMLEKAADLLDAYPQVAILSARVLVGPEQREDPACGVMAAS